MKKKQNFTIDENVTKDFRKICEMQMIPMSKLIENYMLTYSNEHMHCDVIKFIESNYKEVLKIALEYVNVLELKTVDFSTIVELNVKIRKIITKILLVSCYLDTTFKYGSANLVFLDFELRDILKDSMYDGMLGDMRVVFTHTNNSVLVCRNTLLPGELNINNIEDINQIINQSTDTQNTYLQCGAFEYIL